MVIFDRIQRKELTQEEAAKIFKISCRQVRRKLKWYKIDAFNLHSIFCLKFERIINNDYTLCFKNNWF
jgi:hypothetical protein